VFPAHRILHVAHEYKPIVGFEQIQAADLNPEHRRQEIASANKEFATNKAKDDGWIIQGLIDRDRCLSDACLDPPLLAGIAAAIVKRQSKTADKDDATWIRLFWVDYILTTANSWKMPIQDFELIVEKPADQFDLGKTFVSFCWDGPVEKLDARRFSARKKDFVPKRELHIAFFN
jgi:hypothetical protein